MFFPSSDPGSPPPPGVGRVYEVDVVAVERRGRYSLPVTTSLSFPAALASGGDRSFYVDGSGVIRFTIGDSEFGSGSGTTITANDFTRFGGSHEVGFAPWCVAGLKGGSTVTFLNFDTVSHHLRSVYTPLYRVDPFSPPSANSIGGMPPLDFGVVPAGGRADVVLPLTLPTEFRWTLIDASGPTSPYAPRILLTNETPVGGGTPIGG